MLARAPAAPRAQRSARHHSTQHTAGVRATSQIQQEDDTRDYRINVPIGLPTSPHVSALGYHLRSRRDRNLTKNCFLFDETGDETHKHSRQVRCCGGRCIARGNACWAGRQPKRRQERENRRNSSCRSPINASPEGREVAWQRACTCTARG
jgi:hypothetical protein